MTDGAATAKVFLADIKEGFCERHDRACIPEEGGNIRLGYMNVIKVSDLRNLETSQQPPVIQFCGNANYIHEIFKDVENGCW